MQNSKVLARWRENRPALCTFVQLADPSVPEMITNLSFFDCVWLDLEHGAMSTETASDLMRAVRQGGADILARPAKGEFMRMGRLLEAGANGILYPRCETAEEAREMVRWAKFSPEGERGFSGGNPSGDYGPANVAEYVEMANRETFLFPQIESPAAVKNARAIAEVKGVDLLFFGPGDFSVLSGHPGQVDHPSVRAACEETAAAARAAGKRFGTLSFSIGHANQLLKMGATFVVAGYDMDTLKSAYLKLRDDLVPLGFPLRGQAPRAGKDGR